jgi:hypothetical protein
MHLAAASLSAHPSAPQAQLANVEIANAGNVTGNSTINAQQLTALNTEKVNLSGDVTAGKVDITAKGDITVKNITAKWRRNYIYKR